VYSLLGNVSSPRYDLETIQEHTAIVFQRFDKLHQGYITIQDFMSFCLNVNANISKSKVFKCFESLGSNYSSINRCPTNNRVMIISFTQLGM